MRAAFIILAHKNPAQINRFVEKIAHPDIDCYLHYDKKSDAKELEIVANKKNLFFITPSIDVKWGCLSQVIVVLNSLRHILATGKPYDYVCIFSGQDYPLQPTGSFLEFLEKNKGNEFIGNTSYSNSPQNIIRFEKYHFNNLSFPGKEFVQRVVNKMLPSRKFPYNYEIRKGSAWMALTLEAVSYTLDFVAKNPVFVKYFKWVHIPDEFFFHTLLYNSPFRTAIRSEVFHYIDWSQQLKNPKILTMQDKESLLSSDKFFARKFDSQIDHSVLDVLDEKIKNQPGKLIGTNGNKNNVEKKIYS